MKMILWNATGQKIQCQNNFSKFIKIYLLLNCYIKIVLKEKFFSKSSPEMAYMPSIIVEIRNLYLNLSSRVV